MTASTDKSPEFRAAIALLESPESWSRGAAELAALKDSDALLPLVGAYEMRAEGDRIALLDAMEQLGAIDQGAALAQADDADTRRRAMHLMELIADNRHVAVLEAGTRDEDQRVRGQALRALASQTRTTQWQAAMIRLLESRYREVRLAAIDSLATRRSEAARQALVELMESEADPQLHDKLMALVK